jgi:hypothetical protein
MRYHMQGAALVLAAAALAACSEPTSAPAVLTSEAALSVEGRRGVEYSTRCELWYYEREGETAVAREPDLERVWGTGICHVVPFGTAQMKLEGWERYTPGGFQIVGDLLYVFDDGSRLLSRFNVTGGEVIAEGHTPFHFGQHFLRGTGRLARTSGGEGYGEGHIAEATGAVNYRSSGRILFNVDR